MARWMQDAAKHDRLASATYRRLNLGIIAYFAALMVSVAAAPLAALDRWFRGRALPPSCHFCMSSNVQYKTLE